MAEPDLIEWTLRLSRALREAGVKHAVAGGLAVAAHGHQRATSDIDLVIAPDAESLALARAAAASIGALQTKRAVAHFKRIGLLRVVLAPGGDEEPIPVDMLLSPDEMGAQVFARAREVRFGSGVTWVVSVEDLILLKMLRGSPTDIADVRALAAANKIDRAYLERVAGALRIKARLARALPPRRRAAAVSSRASRGARRRGSRGRGAGGRAG